MIFCAPQPAPPRRSPIVGAVLRCVAVLALAFMLALGAGAGAKAQTGIDYRALLSGGASAEPPPAMSRPDDAAPPVARAPEVAAYGAIEGFESDTMIMRTTESLSVFRQRLNRIVAAGPDMFSALDATLARASPDGRANYFLGAFVLAVIALMIGRAGMMLVAVLIAAPIMMAAQRRMPDPVTLGDKLPVLALRFAMTVAVTAFGLLIAAGLCFAIVGDHRATLVTVGIVLGSYSIYVLVDTIWRMTISPYLSAYRIPRLGDQDARRLYLWASFTAAISIAGQGYASWLMAIGASPELHAVSSAALGFVALVIAVALVWANRGAISGAILGGHKRAEASWMSSIAAMFWAPVATLYLITAWAQGAVRLVLGLEQSIPLLAGAFMTVMAGLVVYAGSVFTVEKLFARARRRQARQIMPAQVIEEAHADGGDTGSEGEGGDDEGGPAERRRPAEPPMIEYGPGPRLRTFEDLAQRAAAIFAAGVAFWLLARIWGGAAVFADGARLDFMQDIVDKVFIGYVSYHAVRIWLDKRIVAEGGGPELVPGDEGGGSSASRLATLLPLFRSFILFFILSATILSLAIELGVNVAPLFAGAGVVGLAIGFGAQTLVRDILSGMFFLLDDAFRKGEYIDVGIVKGTVEKISIRSFQLRHHLGALHTIPFGEITHLTNFSRDWVMMKLPLRLTYDTDVERVRKLVKKLGQKLLEHPVEGPKFVQPLKSQGVIQMEDSAMILRVKYMTRPGDQWTTRKLVYHELHELFAREGIHFAHKEVTVRIPGMTDDRKLTKAEAEAVGAAARSVGDNEVPGALASTAALR
ncbi:MAG: small-conductance mechanosensitive channel [Paracoccaceae bacterium]|jgi:small-conductance mechanosensitive channel